MTFRIEYYSNSAQFQNVYGIKIETFKTYIKITDKHFAILIKS